MSREICRTNEQREIHRKKRALEHAERAQERVPAGAVRLQPVTDSLPEKAFLGSHASV